MFSNLMTNDILNLMRQKKCEDKGCFGTDNLSHETCLEHMNHEGLQAL